MLKVLFTLVSWIILAFFLAVGRVGDTYMIALKSKPTFSGTIFDYRMRSSRGFIGLAMSSRVIYEVRKRYPLIVLGLGPRGFIFMKETK